MLMSYSYIESQGLGITVVINPPAVAFESYFQLHLGVLSVAICAESQSLWSDEFQLISLGSD